MEEIRVVLYSHDSQGLGHTRRNLAIAHTLAEQLPRLLDCTVTGLLITGESRATSFESPPGWDWLVLPAICKQESRYAPRHLDFGLGQLIRLRSQVIDAALQAFHPDLVLVDRHAFGVEHELGAALACLRRTNPDCRLVLGLREVLDTPSVARREWAALGDINHLRSVFDEVWVYGDPEVHSPLLSGEIPEELSDRVRFTGFLAEGRRADSPSTIRPPYVMTMVGGGSDGLDLTMNAALASLPAGIGHLIVTGPQMPERHRRQVEQAAGDRARVVESVPDALADITAAEAVVSMGGYNSVCEIMTTEIPALIVPREKPRMEQFIRASALAGHGAVDVSLAHELSPQLLTEWFHSVVGTKVSRRHIDLAGLDEVGKLASALLAGRTRLGSAGQNTAMRGRADQNSGGIIAELEYDHVAG